MNKVTILNNQICMSINIYLYQEFKQVPILLLLARVHEGTITNALKYNNVHKLAFYEDLIEKNVV